MPKFTLCFLTKDLILFGNVDPHLWLMFKPLGDVPTSYTLAPKDFKSFGPDLYPAPFAQSMAILIPFKRKLFGKLLFKISIYLASFHLVQIILTHYHNMDCVKLLS